MNQSQPRLPKPMAMTPLDTSTAPAERRGRSRGGRPVFAVFSVVAVAYAVGALLSWQSFGAEYSPAFFPPAGVTVAAMLLTRRSLWPAIVAAIVLAEVAVDIGNGAPGLVALGWALANLVEPVVGASLVLAWCGGV